MLWEDFIFPNLFVQTDLPDDLGSLRDIENKINGEFIYETSEDVWNETREK